MVKPLDKERLDFYLEQYKRCYTTWIHLNSLGWQVPTATLISATTIVSISLQQLSDPLSRAILFAFAGFFSLLMTVQMAAHRRGLDLLTTYMKYLEKEVFGIHSLPMDVKEIIEFMKSYGGWIAKDKVYHGFLVKQRSYFWFQYTLLAMCVGLWSLAIYNIIVAMVQ